LSWGWLYLVFVAPSLLPNRKAPTDLLSQDYDLKEYVSEVVVTPRSSLVGQSLRSSQLQRRFDIDVLEMIHNGNRFAQPLADKMLSAGDILIVRCGRQDLLKIRDSEGLEILPDVQFGQKPWQADLASGEEGIAEAMVAANSNLIGSTLKELRFRQRYNVTVLAIRRGQDLVRDRLGKVPLRFGDLLLVQGPKQSFVGLQTSRDVLVLEQRDVENMRSKKAALAIAIGFGVVGVAATGQYPILVAALAGAVLMVLTGCLKAWGTLRGSAVGCYLPSGQPDPPRYSHGKVWDHPVARRPTGHPGPEFIWLCPIDGVICGDNSADSHSV
jgi:uncharacterized protein with PhoU and TrkA domain